MCFNDSVTDSVLTEEKKYALLCDRPLQTQQEPSTIAMQLMKRRIMRHSIFKKRPPVLSLSFIQLPEYHHLRLRFLYHQISLSLTRPPLHFQFRRRQSSQRCLDRQFLIKRRAGGEGGARAWERSRKVSSQASAWVGARVGAIAGASEVID